MPVRTIPGTEIKYWLLSFDAAGLERSDDPEGIVSQRLLEIAANEPITNIFLFSHGWRGDIGAAIAQYDSWIRAFMNQAEDLKRASEKFPKFRPLLIGLHWPSEPWGEEEFGEGDSFAPSGAVSGEELIDSYLARIGDTPVTRQCLKVIIEEARANAAADTLPARAREAYLALNEELGLGSAGPVAPPDADRMEFDPDAAFDAANEESESFGTWHFGGILGPLRLLSYWTMKKRARSIGEGGMHTFLNQLQAANQGARIHLMGHSFGCIVVSAMLGGPNGNAPLERPVDSVALIQGALSLWSYAAKIPFAKISGYFSGILRDKKIKGPLITTRSIHDNAVGVLYPLASWFYGSAAFAPESLPEYGAIGSYGIQGLSDSLPEVTVLSADDSYPFAKGRTTNLEASGVIIKKQGLSGAHNDIAGPEIAHVLWAAALASM